jgi:hypothetical protein
MRNIVLWGKRLITNTPLCIFYHISVIICEQPSRLPDDIGADVVT